jgi:SAM-dependent methyltransferase
MDHLDDPGAIDRLRRTISGKPGLRRLYEETYRKYSECLAKCPQDGIAVELGSGGGFAKPAIASLLTSDILPYRGMDLVFDGCHMPFRDSSVRFVAMLNVFHHIADVQTFLEECGRVLAPGGRVLIVDQHAGWISSPILRYIHHEPFRPGAEEWRFETTGPLSGANGALAWIVFDRDREKYRKRFPELALVRYQPHTPLRYWLAGGLKDWSLLPGWAWNAATTVDRWLIRASDKFGSFVDVELVRLERTTRAL